MHPNGKSNVTFVIGQRIRVTCGFGRHGYKPNTQYTVIETDSSDNTLKAQSDSGESGEWIPFSSCVPYECLGWEFLRTVLPTEALELLSAFDGLQNLSLKEEIKENLIKKVPNLPQEILAAVAECDAMRSEGSVRKGGRRLPLP